jgi:hypothetical protein
MVAASTTAILNDIELSSFPRPPVSEQPNSNAAPQLAGLPAELPMHF